MTVDEEGCQLEVKSGQPVMTGGLTSAVIISITTELKSNSDSKYWVDSITKQKTGSRLFQILRGPNTEENRNKIPGAIEEALQWMLDLNVIEKVDVEFELIEIEKIIISIALFEIEDEKIKFSINWAAQKIELLGV